MEPLATVMKTSLISVKPLDTILHARKTAQEHRVNQLLVVQKGKLLGILTDRDLRDAFPSVFDDVVHDATGKRSAEWSPDHVRVESVMTRDVRTLPPDASLADAARLMRSARIGAVPVVDKEGHALGIVTRTDVLEAYVRLDERRR